MARRIKSLKYEPEAQGHGFTHREHRTKKGRAKNFIGLKHRKQRKMKVIQEWKKKDKAELKEFMNEYNKDKKLRTKLHFVGKELAKGV